MAALLRRQWAHGASPSAPDLHVCNAALGACSRVGALEQALSLKVSRLLIGISCSRMPIFPEPLAPCLSSCCCFN